MKLNNNRKKILRSLLLEDEGNLDYSLSLLNIGNKTNIPKKTLMKEIKTLINARLIKTKGDGQYRITEAGINIILKLGINLFEVENQELFK